VGIYDYFYSHRDGQTTANGSSKPPPVVRNGKQHGGGIAPDVVVRIPEPDTRLRDACFEFARLLVAGQVAGFGDYVVKRTEYGYRPRGGEYQLTDQAVAAFRAFLRDHRELQVNEAQVNQNIEYVRRRIRAEVITAAYGVEVAEQFLAESDAQTLRAIEEIPKAKHLTDQARLFPAPPERQ
jgi:carboxyl-terminal processing protease